jgi:hypothetical protein
MWLKRLSPLLVLAIVVSCRGTTNDLEPEPSTGGPSALEAVEELIELLNIPDFQAASALAHPGQAALASLAEGASFGEVASALREDEGTVSANFWSGFAQGTGDFLIGTVEMAGGGVETEGGVEFHLVEVTTQGGEERLIVTRESEGHRVDLFASFGAGLAAQMIAPVERLLTTQTDDAREILAALRDTVPSLLVAAARDQLSPEASQDLTRLIELVTRG